MDNDVIECLNMDQTINMIHKLAEKLGFTPEYNHSDNLITRSLGLSKSDRGDEDTDLLMGKLIFHLINAIGSEDGIDHDFSRIIEHLEELIVKDPIIRRIFLASAILRMHQDQEQQTHDPVDLMERVMARIANSVSDNDTPTIEIPEPMRDDREREIISIQELEKTASPEVQDLAAQIRKRCGMQASEEPED